MHLIDVVTLNRMHLYPPSFMFYNILLLQNHIKNVIDRNSFWKDYCVISKKLQTLPENNFILLISFSFFLTLLKYFQWFETSKKINMIFYLFSIWHNKNFYRTGNDEKKSEIDVINISHLLRKRLSKKSELKMWCYFFLFTFIGCVFHKIRSFFELI